jgi:ubiquitin carboxyl-terminal hydrolase L5
VEVSCFPHLNVHLLKTHRKGEREDIRFSLLAIVDGVYENAWDGLVLAARKEEKVWRRLNELEQGESAIVDEELKKNVDGVRERYGLPRLSPSDSSSKRRTKTHSPSIGAQLMAIDIHAMQLPNEREVLVKEWEEAARSVLRTGVDVGDEVKRGEGGMVSFDFSFRVHTEADEISL